MWYYVYRSHNSDVFVGVCVCVCGGRAGARTCFHDARTNGVSVLDKNVYVNLFLIHVFTFGPQSNVPSRSGV